MQQEDLAVLRPELSEPGSQLAPPHLSVHALGHFIIRAKDGIDPAARVRSQHPSLGPPVMAEEVSRDPIGKPAVLLHRLGPRLDRLLDLRRAQAVLTCVHRSEYLISSSPMSFWNGSFASSSAGG